MLKCIFKKMGNGWSVFKSGCFILQYHQLLHIPHQHLVLSVFYLFICLSHSNRYEIVSHCYFHWQFSMTKDVVFMCMLAICISSFVNINSRLCLDPFFSLVSVCPYTSTYTVLISEACNNSWKQVSILSCSMTNKY